MYTGNLIVKPISAQLTYDSETFGDMDCYCKVIIGANSHRTGVAQDQGKHPNWQDAFTFRINNDQMMQVHIFDHDGCSDDDYVGSATVSLMDVYNRRNVSEWYPLTRKGSSSGKVMIILEFFPEGAQMGMGMNPQMGMGMNPQMGMGYQQPGFGAPMPGYGAPQPGFGQPGYGQPGFGGQPGYGQPGFGGQMGGMPPGGYGGMGGGMPPGWQ